MIDYLNWNAYFIFSLNLGPINCFESCESYYDDNNVFHFETKCPYKCCGTCKERMCCYSPYSEKTLNQSNCEFDMYVPIPIYT